MRLLPLLLLAFLLSACSAEVPGDATPAPVFTAGTPVELRVVTPGGGTTLLDKQGTSYEVGPVALVLDRFTKVSASYRPEMPGWVVDVSLPSDLAEKFAKLTEERVGQQVAIVANGVVQSAPAIQQPITGGEIQITGDFTKDDAEALAAALGGN
ncbi:SecDF P1 head subdomain-containing protein [Amycolatopsis magusensis]|uniref:SecDF P1 head subdomain-containing protein n=1 Tax=Amycolatopsis magusensis TaxID=882444 RepID=UPI003C30265F